MHASLGRPHLRRGWTVAWWALDEIVDDLAGVTVGTGSGARAPAPERGSPAVGKSGGLARRLRRRRRIRPGGTSSRSSHSVRARSSTSRSRPVATRSWTTSITAARRLSIARRTSFVEIGPLFVVGPGWRDRIVPFPEARGMGWGLELEWHELHREGCALGIVDAVRVRHVGERGEGYDYRARTCIGSTQSWRGARIRRVVRTSSAPLGNLAAVAALARRGCAARAA